MVVPSYWTTWSRLLPYDAALLLRRGSDLLSLLELIGTFLVRKLFRSFCDGA